MREAKPVDVGSSRTAWYSNMSCNQCRRRVKLKAHDDIAKDKAIEMHEANLAHAVCCCLGECVGGYLQAHAGSASTPLLPWMVCRCFLGWSASSYELESARRSVAKRAAQRSCVAVGNAAGSETPERCKDTASSRYGGSNGRPRRPFAPPVTCVARGNACTLPEATHVTLCCRQRNAVFLRRVVHARPSDRAGVSCHRMPRARRRAKRRNNKPTWAPPPIPGTSV